jgi:predicted nucleic acid-binding Zn ribbon protein
MESNWAGFWEDYHRKLTELERQHKRRMRIFTTAAVLLLILLVLVVYRY